MSDNDYLEYLRAKVDEMDWVVQGIEDGSVAYTIGLTKRGLPELLMRGVEPQAASESLNALALRQLQPGSSGFEAGQVTQVEGVPVRLDAVVDAAEEFLLASVMYPDRSVWGLELVSLR